MCYSAAISPQDLTCAHQPETRVEDAVLIRDAQQGCTQAFEALVRRYDQAILRLALRLTGSEHDAQDIYQEAFLKAYKNIVRFRSESTFYTWMHRIVTNLCMDRLRSKQSLKETSAVFTSPDGTQSDLFAHIADPNASSDPERQVFRRELRRHILIAMRRLTARERLVFQLKHFEGLKLRTVGELLNTSEETAKNTLFRATHKMRAYLTHVEQSAKARSQLRRSGSMAWSR
jgi:RNA polymerase sigma-70 factor, ECF subfamily